MRITPAILALASSFVGSNAELGERLKGVEYVPLPSFDAVGRLVRFGGRGMKADQRRAKKSRQKKVQRRKDR